MKNFENGVRYYSIATCTVGFPEDDICCFRCPLMGIESQSGREYCRKTGEYLPAPRHIVGLKCPLDFETGEACAK